MAMFLTTVKNTGAETIIHFEAVDASSATITIANLAAASQARNSDAPRVNIVRFVTTGEDGSSIIVSRDGKNIIACAPENAPFLDLTSMGITESIKNDKDILITSGAAKAVSGYITLRKVAGWSGKIETAEFGQYDDPNAVGS
jgi:ribosomal protein S4E